MTRVTRQARANVKLRVVDSLLHLEQTVLSRREAGAPPGKERDLGSACYADNDIEG